MKTSTFGRPVSVRAIRSTHRLASVAVSANCQASSPNRRTSSLPTHAASSVGIIPVVPRRIWRSTARAVGSGAWPAIAPVSPRQKSTNVWPSTSVMEAPRASAMNSGNPPAHIVIQLIGTPPSSVCEVSAYSSRDRGCCSAKRARSRSSSRPSRARSIST